MINTLNQFAEALKIGKDEIKNLPTTSGNELFANGLNLIYFVAGAAAVLVIIFAGFMYATSGGDAAAITKAKNALLYSIVGLVVVALAFVITQFVIGRF
jgi:hypothetical protein